MMMQEKPDLSGQVALVTGASRGFGRAVAMELGRCGAHVIAVARTTGALEELDDALQAEGGGATLVPLDLKDGEGIDRLCGVIHERWGKLDILALAGAMLGPITPTGQMKLKDHDGLMAVNWHSTWRLVRASDALLRAADHGRAVYVTCAEAASARPFFGPYAASKAACETLFASWAQETRKTKMRANCIDPGPMRTHLRGQMMPGENPDGLAKPNEIAPAILPLVSATLDETGRIYDAVAKDWRERGVMHKQ